MNSFEKYLKENKAQLDLEQVSPEIWLSIENELLRKKNKRKIRQMWWISAAATLLIGASLMLYFLSQKQTGLAPVEFLAAQGLESKAFAQELEAKTKVLNGAKIPVDSKEDFELLLKQLEFLDSQYRDYLQFVEQNGYQEFIGTQILNYYRSKIELLDKIQQEIKKIEYYEQKYKTKSPKVELSI